MGRPNHQGTSNLRGGAYRVLKDAYVRASLRLARPVSREIHDDVSRIVERHTNRQMRHTHAVARESYRQVEALVGLYSTLGFTLPLPPMRGYALSPDAAVEIVRLIHESRPSTILELGSGVSTLITAYALRRFGGGRVISLEHDAAWHEIATGYIVEHDLSDYAEVRYAPLEEIEIQGHPWKWYDPSALQGIDSVDMLVVDGPPRSTQPLARYPALPLVGHLLTHEAMIVLDDTVREDERSIIRIWDSESGPFRIEEFAAEKGLTVMRR
ncbi:class I SAM-dependent methyltransferase [Anaerosoma tenue]|uniref:class I SAM-dependent methyltransferase n=1 Tax=Anaerosoma tenue TaxID=2933588 RepID=UPI002260F5D3|nr:class I SAM-dependent methyltransferase [Anaerosoma tenue]MCK8114694.1 class I SAM-dependent methyltransferase [Anaerosoma tenue]